MAQWTADGICRCGAVYIVKIFPLVSDRYGVATVLGLILVYIDFVMLLLYLLLLST